MGSKVKNFNIGDRVGFGWQRWCCGHCKSCSTQNENLCTTDCDQKYVIGPLYWGGYATAMQQPADFFFKLPNSIKVPDEKLPGIFCSGVTVYGGIKRHVKPGDRVAVLGIGGLGHMAIQYLQAWGCKVSAFTRTTYKIFEIQKLGDLEIFDTNDAKVFEDQKGKYDVVLHCLPISDNEHIAKELDLLDCLGKFVVLGLPTQKDPLMINVLPCDMKHISIHFNFWATRKEVNETIEFSVKHNIWPVVELWDFANLPKAYNQVTSSRPIFKGVVKAQGYLDQLRAGKP